MLTTIILVIIIIWQIGVFFKSLKNDALCNSTLTETKQKYQSKFTRSLVSFAIFVGVSIWTYYSTSGISCFFLMLLLVIVDFIILMALLPNWANWVKFKDMTEKQFLELKMKLKKENEEMEKQSQEVNKGLRAYNRGYKIGQFLGGL